MIKPLNIDQSELKRFLENNYSLEILNLTFLPKGETSWCYIVEGRNGKYFLKVYKEMFPFLKEATELTYKLYSDCAITEIVHAIKAKNGETVNFFETYPTVLFNFVEGKEIMEQRLTDEQVKTFGKVLGRIHAATVKVGDYPKRETFESKDKEMFLKVVERIKQHEGNENSYQKQLVDLFMPKRERITQELMHLEKLGRKLRAKNVPFVICHGDPTGGNILIDKDNKLYLVDWDNPILAPKERDLLFFNNRMEPFMKGYAAIVGKVPIDFEAQQFYALEWNVQEVADFGERIFYQNNNDEQNSHDLGRVAEFLDYSGIN